MPLSAKLVVVGGEVKTAEIKLRLPSTIGRGRGATIMLPHPLVSRTHCELFEAGGRLMVRDLGSLNGTFINNERVSEAPLPAGDLLTVGTVTFRAVYETDSESEGPPPGPGPQLKTRAHDTEPNGALRSAATKPAPPKAAPARPAPAKTPLTDEDVEFNFAQPLVDFDDDEGDTGPPPAAPALTDIAKREATVHEVEEVEVVEEAASSTPPTKPAAALPAAMPAPAAKPVPPAAAGGPPAPVPAGGAPASAGAKKDEKKTDISQEEAIEQATEDEDDLNDFLKSLGSK